ncbi:MAG: DUF2975 domain-containing protein [Propionibacteriaceae bacterium]|nr:DUF2975 domain-containing protein [Propionibacteriaceae bacterium]
MTASSPATPTPTASAPNRKFVSRGDFLAARIVVALATVALVIGSLIAMWPSGPLHLTSSIVEEGPAYNPPGLIADATARYASEVEWTLAQPTFGQRALAAVPSLVLLVGGLIIAVCLWRLIGAARSGEPFTRRTLRDAQVMAVVMVGLAAAWPFLGPLVHFMLITDIQSMPSVLFTLSGVDFLPIVVALLLVVLTEVYARGLALREDVDGLI